jgi:ABC-type uncharacterized transport system substrate-binding protein
MMKRRDFITLLGGAAAAWPLAVRAQQPAMPVRRIGVLLPASGDDSQFPTWIGAFLQALGLSGWIIGRNVRIDTRWAGANADAIRRHATELAALAPDVILAHGNAAVGALLQVTRTVPIVFPVSGDPVATGFVDSLARPGGNVTGFSQFGVQPQRKMARDAQADRAGRDASRSPARPRIRNWYEPICRHPSRRQLTWHER